MSMLEKVYNLTKSGGIKLGLDNMYKSMSLLNLDISKLKTVHVAGTNGKGSTSSILQSLMMQALPNDKKVALYTSPHLISFYERIKINEQLISEQQFNDIAVIIFEKCKNINLTFFEFTTLLAFKYFLDNKVDYAVIETGLGGRLDSTNVINSELCIITSIGIDHTEYLGATLNDIATEKAGVFKKNSKVILSKTPCNNILKELAIKKQVSQIFEIDKELKIHINSDDTFNLNINHEFEYKNIIKKLNGKHQYYNTAVALAALNILGFSLNTNQINKAISKTNWKGRLEQFNCSGRIFYLDIGHNEEGIQSLINFLNSKYLIKDINIACGFLKDKNQSLLIKMLSQAANKVFLFPVFAEQRSSLASDYLSVISSDTYKNVFVCNSINEAGFLMNKESGISVFTGSTYSYSAAFNYVKEWHR